VVKLDLPFPIAPKNPCVYCEGRNYYTYWENSYELDGKDVIALIIYEKEQESTVKAFEGFLGDLWDVVKVNTYYNENVPLETITDDQDNIIVLTDPVRLWSWIELPQ